MRGISSGHMVPEKCLFEDIWSYVQMFLSVKKPKHCGIIFKVHYRQDKGGFSMKRMKIIVMLTVMAVMMSMFAGCGNTEDMSPSLPVDEVENIAASLPADDVPESVEKTVEPVAEEESDVENESTVAEEAASKEAAATEEPVAKEKPAATEKLTAKEEPATTGKTVQTGEAEVQKEDPAQGQTINDMPAQTQQPASSETVGPESVGSEQPHEHNWIAHTDQRWVPQIVTVVDEPERYEPYTIYKMYWYNTGTWEETRDVDRFIEWGHDSEGGAFYPAYHIEKNEDNPLFLGYNELGQPSFTGDHVLWTDYDLIPAVTHEEDQGYYEIYVDYYYCECGATK